jgi:hypothetical protein
MDSGNDFKRETKGKEGYIIILLAVNDNSIHIMHLPEESEKGLNGQLLFYEPMILHSVYMMISASKPCE